LPELSIGTTLVGADSLIADLNAISARVNVALENAANKSGQMLVATFDRRFEDEGPGWAPLKPSTLASKRGSKILTETGSLRGSIAYHPDKKGGGFVGILRSRPGKGGGKGPKSPVAANVALCHELGTSKMVARPFIEPTYREKKDEIVHIYAEALGRIF